MDALAEKWVKALRAKANGLREEAKEMDELASLLERAVFFVDPSMPVKVVDAAVTNRRNE